jgi:hypothetical protein
MARGGTPAIVALNAAQVQFDVHEFAVDPAERNYGEAAALALGVELDRVFKTLIVTVDEREHVVGIVPVACGDRRDVRAVRLDLRQRWTPRPRHRDRPRRPHRGAGRGGSADRH